MSFITLAQEAQKELELERERLAKKEAKIDEKASAVEAQLALAVEDTKKAAVKTKELQAYEEEVTRKALSFKSDFDAKAERQAAAGDRTEAEKARKDAKEHLDRSQQMLAELSKRELALSEREKTYKQDIENEVLRNIAFRK
jgi:hypothetical protein